MWVSTLLALMLASGLFTEAVPGHAFELPLPDPALSSRLRHIESAFREGDAGSLRLSFSSGGRVRVELRDLPEGQGAYGPGQLQAIFNRIFEQVRTEDFAFGKDDVRVAIPGTAFARGRWVRRAPTRGPETVDMLTFTLREESGDWRILEIRSSSH
jgi:hypothetical protein